MLTDSHFHALDLEELDPDWLSFYREAGIFGAASCHSLREYEHVDNLRTAGLPILACFGVHPQAPAPDELPAIERLAAEGRLDAIGECGFDLFDERYASSAAAQRAVFDAQAETARRSGLPIVLHVRKAMAEVFRVARELKRLPSVIFHAWPGSPEEAKALLSRGVNAYFSLGAQAMNGRRLSERSARELPLDRILVETDAPYQKPRERLAGHSVDLQTDGRFAYCRQKDLLPIYSSLAEFRRLTLNDVILLTDKNFRKAFQRH